MDSPPNRLKARLQAGQPSLGLWLQAASPALAEMAGFIGLDFVVIDQEHGPGDLQTTIDMMRAVAASGTTAMVRVPGADPLYLKRILDAGAQALLVPMVDTVEEARRLVESCLYPPRGRRGNASLSVRGSRYGLTRDYVGTAHETLLIVPQVETATAVTNAAGIAAVEGVDAVFIGPNDLSGSIGLPGQTGAPEVERLIAQAVDAVRAQGKPVGSVPRVGKSWQALFDEGYGFIAGGGDITWFRDAGLAQAEAWSRYQQDAAGRIPGRAGLA